MSICLSNFNDVFFKFNRRLEEEPKFIQKIRKFEFEPPPEDLFKSNEKRMLLEFPICWSKSNIFFISLLKKSCDD